MEESTGAGVRHLEVLARRPRPAGGEDERIARAHAASVLVSAGFTVREEAFTYSELPGRYGTPLGGALLAASLVIAAVMALRGASAVATFAEVAAGVVATAVFARWMTAGVLDLAWMRARSVNLVATRGPIEPSVWLVAHLDSKSQPVPSAARVGGVLVVGLSLALSVVAIALTLTGHEMRTLWYVVVGAAVLGVCPVLASVVGVKSDGAVDNASGAAAVLAAAEQLDPRAAVGVLIPSAEELGLAGAAAWARGRAAGVAINCDGVDDDGALVIMYNGRADEGIVAALGAAAGTRVAPTRMPLGLLTDSTALARAGWRTVTVSHGSLKTLRRVHTPADSLSNMRGTKIDEVARILARAAEALA